MRSYSTRISRTGPSEVWQVACISTVYKGDGWIDITLLQLRMVRVVFIILIYRLHILRKIITLQRKTFDRSVSRFMEMAEGRDYRLCFQSVGKWHVLTSGHS